MKKALSILLIFSICLASCKKDDDDNNRSNSSSSSSSGPGDFMISITVDGVTHKAEGNIPSDLQSSMSMYGNHCLKYVNNSVIAGLADKSAASYVSGEVFCLNINFPNLSVGNSVGILSAMQVSSSGSMYGSYLSNLNFPNGIALAHGLSQTIDTISSHALLNVSILYYRFAREIYIGHFLQVVVSRRFLFLLTKTQVVNNIIKHIRTFTSFEFLYIKFFVKHSY